jgi:hypothetical protein
MSQRREAALTLALLGTILALGAWREHARLGIEMQYVLLVSFLAAPGLRRVFSLVTDLSPPGRLTTLLELASLSSLVSFPVGAWGAPLAALAALSVSLPSLRPSGPERSRAGLALLVATLALALSSLVFSKPAQDSRGAWASGPLLVLALEALLPPWRARLEDTLRRANGFIIIAALARLHGHFGYRARETGCVALGAATAIAFFALADFVLRIFSSGEDALLARRRRFAFSVLACLVPLALVWAGGEVVLRLRGATPARTLSLSTDADSERNTYHVPGERFVQEGPRKDAPPEEIVYNEFVWNKEGFHDADHEQKKSPDSLRVLVLGDSFVEGSAVKTEELLHRRLEPLLARAADGLRVESMAYGWSGWGQRDELACLRERGLAYAPDLVLLEFYPANDLGDNHPKIREQRNPSLAGLLSIIFANRGLPFAALVSDRLDHFLSRVSGSPVNVDQEVYARDLAPARAALWEDAWRETDALVGEIAAASSGIPAPLVLVIFPPKEAVQALASPGTQPAGLDLALPARKMSEICLRRSIPCLDLGPRFAALDPGERSHLYLESDGHWSRAGHDRAAREVARFLVSETAIFTSLVERARASH